MNLKDGLQLKALHYEKWLRRKNLIFTTKQNEREKDFVIVEKIQETEAVKTSLEDLGDGAQSFGYTKDLKVFLTNLVVLRNEAKITQAKMASLISTSYRNYQRLEKGDAEFSFSQILKISNVLKCGVGDLFYFNKKTIQSLIMLTEAQVISEFNLKEFVDFNKMFFNAYFSMDSDENILNFTLRNLVFRNHQLPLCINDFDHEAYNIACEKFVSKKNILVKRKAGFAFKDQMKLLNLLDRLLLNEERSFYCKYSFVLIVDGEERAIETLAYITHDKNNQCYISMTVQ
ncbi:MAG: helix-turn-helix transcriptional regulator [Bacteriovorax sp.]